MVAGYTFAFSALLAHFVGALPEAPISGSGGHGNWNSSALSTVRSTLRLTREVTVTTTKDHATATGTSTTDDLAGHIAQGLGMSKSSSSQATTSVESMRPSGLISNGSIHDSFSGVTPTLVRTISASRAPIQTITSMGQEWIDWRDVTYRLTCPQNDTACYSTCSSMQHQCYQELDTWSSRQTAFQESMISRFNGGVTPTYVGTETYTQKSLYTTHSYEISEIRYETTFTGSGLWDMSITQGDEMTTATWRVPIAVSTISAWETEELNIRTATLQSLYPFTEPQPACPVTHLRDFVYPEKCEFGKACNSCTISGGTVQLLYFPASRTKYGEQVPQPTTFPPVTEVVTAVHKNFTMTSPTIYISFNEAYAQNECGTQIGKRYPGAIMPMNLTDLSSVYGGYGTVYLSDPLNPYTSTPYLRAGQFTLADLNWPPPIEAFKDQLQFVLGRDIFWAITSPYNPILQVPPQIRSMDPAWQSCGLDWEGLYDPPLPLKPATAIALPTMSVGKPMSEPPIPASSLEAPVPSQTPKPDLSSLLNTASLSSTKPDPQTKPQNILHSSETSSSTTSTVSDTVKDPEPSSSAVESSQGAPSKTSVEASTTSTAAASVTANDSEPSSNPGESSQEAPSKTHVEGSTTSVALSSGSPTTVTFKPESTAAGKDPATSEATTSNQASAKPVAVDTSKTSLTSDHTTAEESGNTSILSKPITAQQSTARTEAVTVAFSFDPILTSSEPPPAESHDPTSSASKAPQNTDAVDPHIVGGTSVPTSHTSYRPSQVSNGGTPESANVVEPSESTTTEVVTTQISFEPGQTSSTQKAPEPSNAAEVFGEAQTSSMSQGNSPPVMSDPSPAASDPPAATMLAGHTVAGASTGGGIVVDGVSMTFGGATTRYQTFYSFGTDGVVVDSSTIAASAIASILPHPASQKVPEDMSSSVGLPSTAGQEPVRTAVVSVGGVVVTAVQSNSDAAVIGSQTISVAGPAATISGVEISLGSSNLVAKPTPVNVEPSSTFSKQLVAVISGTSTTVTAVQVGQSRHEVVVESHTLSAGGSAIVVEEHTLSMATGGLVVAGTGSTHTAAWTEIAVPPASSETITAVSVTELSTGFTAIQTGPSGMEVALGDQTLTAGGSAMAIGTQTVSLATEGIVLADANGTRTALFSTETRAAPTLPQVAKGSSTSEVPDLSSSTSTTNTPAAISSSGSSSALPTQTRPVTASPSGISQPGGSGASHMEISRAASIVVALLAIFLLSAY